MIKNLDTNINYWLVRTSDGDNYDEFVADNFIAIGWNEISDLDLIRDSATDENMREQLKKIITETLKQNDEKDNKKQAGLILSYMDKFVNVMKINDIVLIPSKGSNLIEFGIIESDPYIYNKKLFNPEDDECNFVKRRKVKWIHREKRNHLDPYLYRLLYRHNAISDANDYAHNIDRTINKFYVKENKAHFILEVRRESDIFLNEMADLMSNTLKIIDDFNEAMGTSYDKKKIQMQINVQSPGFLEIFGNIETIFIVAGTYAAIFGAKIKVPGFEFDTDGLIEKIRRFIETNQHYRLENKKLALRENLIALDIDVPPELAVNNYDDDDEKMNKDEGVI